MKKQFQILATTIISIAIVSCSKQGVEKPETAQNVTEEISTTSSSSSLRTAPDPLNDGLDGWFTFDQTLADKTKKLRSATVLLGRAPSYVNSRLGAKGYALHLDSSYYLKIFKVPQKTNTSISLWMKYGNVVPYIPFLHPLVAGAGIGQNGKTIVGQINTPLSNAAFFGEQSEAWHHVVVTYDGSTVKLYIDGTLNGTASEQGRFNVLTDFMLGVDRKLETRWTGYIDELRFYSRTLTATDVQDLYNL